MNYEHKTSAGAAGGIGALLLAISGGVARHADDVGRGVVRYADDLGRAGLHQTENIGARCTAKSNVNGLERHLTMELPRHCFKLIGHAAEDDRE